MMPFGRRRSAFLAVAMSIAVAGCGPSGALGTVPTAPPTPAPSADAGPPDMTPEPSGTATPSATPTTAPSGDPATTPGSTAAPTQARATRWSSAPTTCSMASRASKASSRRCGTCRRRRVSPGQRWRPCSAPRSSPIYDSLSTAIPAGTRLLGLSIRDGVATVDLSREFETGGGSASAFRRLGQVVYTLTQFTTVRSVLFQVEGRTVTTFGSEGIVLDGPQTRADYEDILPSIFVDRPAFGAAAGNPVRVTGNANVFEATFRIAILDGNGRSIADEQAMATCGSGCRGTFDKTIRYDVGTAQWGTLRTYFGSAKDGSPQDIRDYPVWLTPAS